MTASRNLAAARAAVRASSSSGSCATRAHLALPATLRQSDRVHTFATSSLHAGGTFGGIGGAQFEDLFFLHFRHFHSFFDEIGVRARLTPWKAAPGTHECACMFAIGTEHMRELWSTLTGCTHRRQKLTYPPRTGLPATGRHHGQARRRPLDDSKRRGAPARTGRHAVVAHGAPAAPAQTARATAPRCRAGSPTDSPPSLRVLGCRGPCCRRPRCARCRRLRAVSRRIALRFGMARREVLAAVCVRWTSRLAACDAWRSCAFALHPTCCAFDRRNGDKENVFNICECGQLGSRRCLDGGGQCRSVSALDLAATGRSRPCS